MRLREQQRACEVLANYSLDSNADAKLKMAVAATKEAEAKAKKAEQEALASRELAASANTKMIGMLLGGLAAGMGAIIYFYHFRINLEPCASGTRTSEEYLLFNMKLLQAYCTILYIVYLIRFFIIYDDSFKGCKN